MRLFEGYFDSVEHKNDDIVKDIEDSNINDSQQGKFNHYIDIASRVSGMYIDKKAKGYDNLIKYVISHYLDKCDYLDYYKVVYVDRTDDEFNTLSGGLSSGFVLQSIRIKFNVDDNLSYKAIMNILFTFLKMNRKLNKVVPNIIYLEGFTLDGNENFNYDNFLCNAMIDKVYSDKKQHKVIKHFILQLNKKRAVAKQHEGKFDDYNNYLGLHIMSYEFQSMFCEKEDMLKCRIYRINEQLYVEIPENTTVYVHADRASNYGKFRVKGTLILKKHLSKGNVYHTNNYSFAKYLDDEFMHNHIIYKYSFADAPYFSDIKSELNMEHKKIVTVDITANDVYIDDEDELKDVVRLSNDENISMINYIITEEDEQNN